MMVIPIYRTPVGISLSIFNAFLVRCNEIGPREGRQGERRRRRWMRGKRWKRRERKGTKEGDKKIDI